MINSALAALIGLFLAIFLIIKKVHPVYGLMLGAVVGGLLGGLNLTETLAAITSGVKDIVPAVLRILAAGVLTGALIKTGAAASLSGHIVNGLGKKNTYLAIALSTMILSCVGVFVDIAVITVAPIALMLVSKNNVSLPRIFVAMTGGAKCGNIMSPNPNTIAASDNLGAGLSQVMGAGVVPGLIGLAVLVFVILPLIPDKKSGSILHPEPDREEEKVPSLAASLSGPVFAIILLALRPVAGIVIDPFIALPAGGIVTLLATRNWKNARESVGYGLEKMSGVAVLLIGTGAIAGIIKNSSINDILASLLSSGGDGVNGLLLYPLAGILMAAATASTTAGATIASSSFAGVLGASGVTAVEAASMVNAGATVIDHLPHGSFFHATGGAAGLSFRERLALVPYEALTGLVLTLGTIAWSAVF